MAPQTAYTDSADTGRVVAVVGQAGVNLGGPWDFADRRSDSVVVFRLPGKRKGADHTRPLSTVPNPMYLGRYLLILGFVVTTGNAFMMVLYTVFYWFYMVNRVQREEPVLEEIFGEPYRLYCRQVNRFLPGTKRLDRHFWFFNWKIMFENHGHWNLLAVVAGYGYLLGFQALVV